VARGWGARVRTQKVNPRARSTSRKEGSHNGPTLSWVAVLWDPLRRITIKSEECMAINIEISIFSGKFAKVRVVQLRIKYFKAHFYTLSMCLNAFLMLDVYKEGPRDV